MHESTYVRKESFKLFNHIADQYDRLNRILSLNLDASWRRRVAEHLPPGNGLTLLDVATGTGDQIISLFQHARTLSSCIGLDPAEKMVEIAKTKVEKLPFSEKVDFVVGSGTELPFDNATFDAVSLSFGIRNIDDRPQCLREILRVLKPDGRLLLLEFSVPKNLLIRPFALAYMRFVLPGIGGLISKNRKAYSYLNDTIRAFPTSDSFREQMLACGFSTVSLRTFTCGIATLYIGVR